MKEDVEAQRARKGPSSDETGGPMHRLTQQAPFVLFVAALTFLAFVGGAMMTIAGIPPAGQLRDAYRAAAALYEKHNSTRDPLKTDLWGKPRKPEGGLSVYDRDLAQHGLTLYTSGHAGKAFLIDMQGKVVHEWDRPYSSVWDSAAAIRKPVRDSQITLLKAHLFPNGDLLGIYSAVGDTPYGYGMVKLDAQSNLIWKNLDYFHHDFAVGADGLIYGLTQDFRTEQPENVDHLDLPAIDDYLVVVSADGQTLRKISLIDALNRSDFRRMLWLVPFFSLVDPLHTNNVDILDEETAARLKAKIPAAAAGQVLLSFRELAGGAIALLDIAAEKLVWVSRGSWQNQHDPDLLPSGNILLFDNRGHYGPGGQSRVIEIDPGSGAVVWEYAGDADHFFESEIRSDQQRLPNGNVLISESSAGRLLEVSRAGEVVWEFSNPVRADNDNGDPLTAIVNWAERIDPQRLDNDFRARLNQAQ